MSLREFTLVYASLREFTQVYVSLCEFMRVYVRFKLVRVRADGPPQQAFMEPGPKGFAMATFAGEEPKSTELPNIKKKVKVRGKAC